MPVTKLAIVEDAALLVLLEAHQEVDDGAAVGLVGLAVLVAQVFAQGRLDGDGVDELHLAAAACLLAVGDNPDEGADARIIKHILGHGDNGFEQVVLDDVAAQVALTAVGIAREEGGTVVNLDNARALLVVHHAAHVVGEEEHLRVANAGHEAQRAAVELAKEARVGYAALVCAATHGGEVVLPRCAKGRVGDAEVKLATRVAVVADGAGVGKAHAADAVLLVSEARGIAREHEVGLTGGEGFGL